MHTDGYWDHITNEVSVEGYHDSGKIEQPLISVEALPESGAMLDFKAFALEYPTKILTLLDRLRPEFKELFIEYYMLGKSQNFLGNVHGQIQTRIWQNLRVIEQAVGALIVLGPEPAIETLRPALEKTGLENTEYGSLAEMIHEYDQTRSYAKVAKIHHAPIPAIRKIFRPAIDKLLAAKDMKTIVVGAFLRNLTHQASLTKDGFSKSYRARMSRIATRRFTAPEPENSALVSNGLVEVLGDMPWGMLEMSPEYKVNKVFATIRKSKKYVFKDKPGQVFAPVDDKGDLKLGYFFARGKNPYLTCALTRLRGICEVVCHYDDQGKFMNEITVPDLEVQALIAANSTHRSTQVKRGDFVEVMTGDISHYCGEVTAASRQGVVVEINFPSGRKFIVHASPESVKKLDVPKEKRAFWGVIQDAEIL